MLLCQLQLVPVTTSVCGPGSLQLVLVMIMTSADTDLKGLKAAVLTTCTVCYLGPSVSYCCSFLVVSDSWLLTTCGVMY